MATKGRTPKHPKSHKGIRNTERPNGKAWKGGDAARAEREFQRKLKTLSGALRSEFLAERKSQ